MLRSKGGQTTKSVVTNDSDDDEQHSTSSESGNEKELRTNDIKLQQMRRIAKKKRNHRDPTTRPQVV